MKLTKAMQEVVDRMAAGYWLIQDLTTNAEWLEPDPMSPETENIHLDCGAGYELAFWELIETDYEAVDLLRGMYRFTQVVYRLNEAGRAAATKR